MVSLTGGYLLDTGLPVPRIPALSAGQSRLILFQALNNSQVQVEEV